MDIVELTAWLNAVVDAQAQWSARRGDEYWGFFTEWRDSLKDAAWDMMES